MSHLSTTVRYSVMLLLALTSMTGCSSLALNEFDWMAAKKYATPKKPVIEILALWEPAEGKGVDGMPTRGFSGQIMFFQHNNTSPIYAKGDVTIHLYDDQGDLEQQSKPLHQYKFDSGAWQVHGVDSTLGPAYQVFIPYVRKGRNKVECALRVQLSQENSSEIYSSMISVKLDGTTPEDTKEISANEKLAKKSNVTVDTLARRESGKQLELPGNQRVAHQKINAREQQALQQVSTEIIEPITDERDERIKQLEDQMSRLLNAQNRQSTNQIRQGDFNESPSNSAGYRKYRLSGSGK